MTQTQAGSTATGQAGALYLLILVAATFLMASGFIAGKILLVHVPALLLVGWRFVLAALATLPFAWLAGEPLLPRFPDRVLRAWATIVAIGLLQTAGVMGFLFLGLRSISPTTAAILLFTNPIWVALFGRVFIGERLSLTRMAGLLAGFAGVVLALGASDQAFAGEPLGGKLLGLAAALSWAFATLINKQARLPIGAWTLSFWQMLFGALALLVLALAQGEHWPVQLAASDWAWFVWLAIPGSTGSFGLWFMALRKGGATRTSGYLFLAPLFTVLMSMLLLGTSLTLAQAAGGILIGAGLWLVNRS